MADLAWSQAGTTAIQMDGAGTVWNSGHVNAILPLRGGGILVAADTGGVWSASETGTAIPAADWDAPDLLAMARGPDGDSHAFVGGGTGIALSAPETVVTRSPDALHAFAVGQDHALWHYQRVGGTWSPPECLGPDVVGPPAVCSWGGSRLDVFVIGTDGALYHKWFDGTAWGPSATGYERLGGVCIGQPTVCSWGPDRLDVFVIGTDHALYHKWWDGRGWGPSADGYEPMGGALTMSPVAIAIAPMRLDVFAVRQGDHELLHKRYEGGWSPSVTGWATLGPVANVPAACTWGANTVHVCAVQPDGSLGYKQWNGSSWTPSWTALGALTDRFITAPALASWGPNRLDLVGVDATGRCQHKWCDGGTWGPSATTWEDMGVWCASHAELTSPGAQKLDVVIAGGDGSLYWKCYDGGWSPAVDQWSGLASPVIGALHESDVNAPEPLRSWRDVPLPPAARRVVAILVLAARRRIVLACDHGLWWSPIPAASARGAGYRWTEIPGLPDGTWTGLAQTGDDSFAAAMWGADVRRGAHGLFTGTFSAAGTVTMTRSRIAGADPRLMARTSVASCDSARNHVYAVASDVWGDHVYSEQPEVVCWGPNRIDVFTRGAESQCAHLAWNGVGWSWDDLGGTMLGPPRAVAWGPDRLDVFCVGTNRALHHKAWDGRAWSEWENKGGVCASDPAVCSWGANRLDVFVVGTDGKLYHQWWGGGAWGPSYQGFEDLGGALWGNPCAVCPGAGRIDVYATGTDGKLQLRRWNGSGWEPWRALGDDQTFNPTAVVSAGGVVDVFCNAVDSNVLHKRWDGARWLPSATTYEDLGGGTWDGPTAIVEGGTLLCYVRGRDNQIYLRTRAAGATTWTDWAALGGNALGTPTQALCGAPKAASWGPGRRDVFVKVPADPKPQLWVLWSSGGSTPAWGAVGGSLRLAVAPDSIYTFLHSTDGGASFAATGMYMSAVPEHYQLDISGGNQGFYNNCLAVRPSDPRTVALGWRGGPYLTSDGGDTWRRIDDGDGAQNCHGDVHTVVWDAAGQLYSGSDGGVAVTADLGGRWRSGFNRGLHTLQVYGGGVVAFSASYQVDGLVVAGLQDNGNIGARTDTGEPWRQFMQSDGGITVCLRTGQILYTNNMDARVSVFRWGGAGAKVPLTVAKPGQSPSTGGQACNPHIVNAPVFRNAAGELMIAAGSDGNDLYGGFARDDGSNLHWEYLGSISTSNGAVISCCNSGDGRVLLCGFDDGRIATFDTAARRATFQTVYAGKDGAGTIVRVLMHDTTSAYAIAKRGASGIVLRFAGGVWERVTRGLPLEPFWGLTTDWTVNPKTMFVSTDSRVYRSSDGGESWTIQARGLPRRAHLGELDFAMDSRGGRWLYAASWGRSIFRSPVT